MKKLGIAVLCAGAVALLSCGGVETDPSLGTESQALVTCYAYLLDNADFSGPLAPWPVTGAPGECITLPIDSMFRTSSFRLAYCGATFFDGRLCTMNSYSASTSGVMPAYFDNRTVSLRFF